ncbi:5-methylcytosine restriction system specificity protein McrC [Streptomyces sp. INA 01156]
MSPVLSPATSPAAALHALDRIRYTRLNARYRAAHTWARLILRGGGVNDLLTDRGTAADGLLLRMPALWEAVVRRLAVEAAARHGGRVLPSGGGAGITVRGDLGNTSAFRPDVLLELPAGAAPPARRYPWTPSTSATTDTASARPMSTNCSPMPPVTVPTLRRTPS